LHEQTETIPFTSEDVEAWRAEWSWKDRSNEMPPAQRKRRRATGRLRIELPGGFLRGRSTFSEGARGPLEAKIPTILSELEDRGRRYTAWAAEHARIAEIQRQEALRREEQARLARTDRARAERLQAEAQAWRRAHELQEYVDAVRAHLPSLSEEDRSRVEPWCTWAEDWLIRSDPVRSPSLIVGLDDPQDQFFRGVR
jgi:hypothetical protein